MVRGARPVRLGDEVVMSSGGRGLVVGEEWHGNDETVTIMELSGGG